MKKIILSILALILFSIIYTNPNEQQHKEGVRLKLKELRSINHYPNNLSDESLIELVETDNYILFSGTKIIWNGSTIILGTGFWGIILITDEYLERILLDASQNY